jgi:hypothetical protein
MSRHDAEAALDAAARELAAPLGVDGPGLLRERAEILGIEPAGTVSAGGTCRLLPARDGRWAAMNLARRSDVELLAAWMGHEWRGPVWDAVAEHLLTVSAADAVQRAQLLGIPAAVAVAPPDGVAVRVTPGARARARSTPVVVDLSALWAGPLCTRILAAHGAHVIKVELSDRPDGARDGHPEFWSRMNGMKEEHTVDRTELARLVDDGDIVVTSARPRAIEQLHLDLAQRVAHNGLLWVAISGYGSGCPDRVAFGDDAAVAGGLAVAAGGPNAPEFVGDAVADPMAGIHAASATVSVLESGSGGILDVSMRDAVATALRTPKYHPIDVHAPC